MGEALHISYDEEILRMEESQPKKNQTLWEVLGSFIGKVNGPPDWAKEHDCYLYSVPKGKG